MVALMPISDYSPSPNSVKPQYFRLLRYLSCFYEAGRRYRMHGLVPLHLKSGLRLVRVSPKHCRGGQYRVRDDAGREQSGWGQTLYALACQLKVLRLWEEADRELVEEPALNVDLRTTKQDSLVDQGDMG
jgi:hypothetical protein